MLPNDMDIISIANLESAITGIIAGFALTIVVLLVERLASKSPDVEYDATLGSAAITVFVTTFFTSMLASYLFAVNAAEIENSARAFMLVMPPAFAFAISSILLVLGLVLLLEAYKLSYAAEPAKITFYVVIVFVLFYYTYTAIDVTAVVYEISSPSLLSQPGYVMPLLAVPFVGVITGLILRWHRHRSGDTNFNPRHFRGFTVLCTIVCASIGMLSAPISNAPTNLFIPFWQVECFVVAMCMLVGWSILYVPTSS